MRPQNFSTQIFLDSGDPAETREALSLLGFLDGQTTNPSLIAKNPAAKERLARGEKFSKKEVYTFYRAVVSEVSGLLPQGSVSIEVYADAATMAEEMLREAREMWAWIPNAHIKFPTTTEGIKAAHQAIAEKMSVNMTLVFTQEQAAGVYAATRGAKKGDIFVSPFVGRLDDRGENGMQLIENILKMYRSGDGHVEVLTASVRNLEHFLYAIHLGSEIITAPLTILKAWADKGMPLPDASYAYPSGALAPLPYHELDLAQDASSFPCSHELLDKGIAAFAKDWNTLIN